MRKNTKISGVVCPKCGSEDIVKGGRYVGVNRKNKIRELYIKQKYRCRKCYHNFSLGPPWQHFSFEMIEDAIKLSYNHPVREVPNLIKDKYGIEVSFNTIYRWLQQYGNSRRIYGILLNIKGLTAVDMLIGRLNDHESRITLLEKRVLKIKIEKIVKKFREESRRR